MNKMILILFSFLFSHSLEGQTKNLTFKVHKPKRDTISNEAVIGQKLSEAFRIVDQMPAFTGGSEAMNKFLQDNIVYPAIGVEKGIQGKVFLKFKIDTEGKISDIEVLKGIKGYPEFEKEAIRLVSSMPKWIPGRQNGRLVPVMFTIPVNFSLK